MANIQDINRPPMLDSTGRALIEALKSVSVRGTVVDDLDTQDSTKPLSANMGNTLQTEIVSDRGENTPYSSSSAYSEGDYCIYDKTLYKCTTDIAAPGEAWSASHWQAMSLKYIAENSGNDVQLSIVNGMLCVTYETT